MDLTRDDRPQNINAYILGMEEAHRLFLKQYRWFAKYLRTTKPDYDRGYADAHRVAADALAGHIRAVERDATEKDR